ncbi:ABC transporter permease [Limnochorda pilosa]|uniref:ABC transporter permease n=1 Tax=Limnochorda pilosa TaxID=1555112 RepID=A0A0K2SN87_LIMPI|nr:ABC transporter permease [Limnochorda pilosa]
MQKDVQSDAAARGRLGVGVRAAARGRALGGKRWAPYLFLSPALLFGAVFFLLPTGFSFYLTFTSWNPLSTPRWVGLKNFEYILTRDPYFWHTLRNTFVFALGTVLVGTAVALLIAFVFTRSRGKSIWRTFYWLPMVTNVVAISYMWVYLYDPVYGAINAALRWLGIPGPNWLSDPGIAMLSVIIVAVWAGLGGHMLIFSAGLEGIDDQFYEAARVDGTSTWDEFLHITLPLLRPTLLFVLVTGFIGGLSNFALIMVMTNGGPMQATNVTANYMYQTAFQNLRMGRAAAMAYILFGFILLITLIQLRIFRKGGVESY